MVWVVGVGPGSPDYVSPAAWEAVRAAELLVGSARALEPFRALGKETVTIDGHISEVLDRLEELDADRRVAVCVSGDPGLFSLLAPLRRRLGAGNLTVVPGVGAAQLLVARLALGWERVAVVSLHGRDDLDVLVDAARAGRPVCVYTDDRWPPARIGAGLLGAGLAGETRAVVGIDLSYGTERIIDTTLDRLVEHTGDGLQTLYLEGGRGD